MFSLIAHAILSAGQPRQTLLPTICRYKMKVNRERESEYSEMRKIRFNCPRISPGEVDEFPRVQVDHLGDETTSGGETLCGESKSQTNLHRSPQSEREKEKQSLSNKAGGTSCSFTGSHGMQWCESSSLAG